MRLILMRHAKSSWDDICQPDHDRILNERGRRNAQAMGDWLREHAYLPDLILCSTAARTRETLRLLRLDAPVRYEDRLYHASADTLLTSLQDVDGKAVLIVAHNPGIGTFASRMLKRRPTHPRFANYPTCATLVARFDIADWSSVSPGIGAAEAFIVPRDLPGQQ